MQFLNFQKCFPACPLCLCYPLSVFSLPFCFRNSARMSRCGPRCNAVDRGGPHVHHHLLRLCGVPPRKPLPLANSEEEEFNGF